MHIRLRVGHSKKFVTYNFNTLNECIFVPGIMYRIVYHFTENSLLVT